MKKELNYKDYRVSGVIRDERPIMVVGEYDKKKDRFQVYTGDLGYHYMTESDKSDMYVKKALTSKYLPTTIPEGYDEVSLEDYYKIYNEDAKNLKDETKGKINMFVSSGYIKTALKFLHDSLYWKNLSMPEPLKDYEHRFITNTNCGPFRYAQEYKGDLYKYDRRSYHASIYTSNKLVIPMKAGILKTMTQEYFNTMEYIEFGIYKCKVLKNNVNENGEYFTHIELTEFRINGYDVKVIEEENNFLSYPRNYCQTGKQILGEYGTYLYKIKNGSSKSNKLASKLLKVIMGELSKRVKLTGGRLGEKDLERDDIYAVETTKEGEVISITLNQLSHPFGRLRPFFYSKCRLDMIKEFNLIKSNIVFSHTDSLISKVPLDLIDNGDIGDFKYEGCCKNGYIKNKAERSPNKDFSL